MKVLRLAFYFDLVCPWCWIALRQLESAKARLKESHPGIDVQVDFRSYPLLPELPAAGVDYHAFYSLRFRDPAALAHRRAQVQRAGEGIVPPFGFDRIKLMPNTLLAHRLVDFARGQGGAAALVEALFSAYFSEGGDIGNRLSLLEIAAATLPSTASLTGWLEDEAARARLPHEARREAPAGLGGVPYLTAEGGESLSGVSSVDYLHYWLGAAVG